MNFNFVLEYSLPATDAAAAVICRVWGLALKRPLSHCPTVPLSRYLSALPGAGYDFNWLAWLSCNSLSSELIRVEKIRSSWRFECHRVAARFVWSCLNRDHQKVIEWNEEHRRYNCLWQSADLSIRTCVCACASVVCSVGFLSILLFDFYQS